MKPAHRILLLWFVPCCALAAAAAYGYFVGFPKTINGHRVHRVMQREPGTLLQPAMIYYAYRSAGKEIKHGPFQRFENGTMVQSGSFTDGKPDGTETFFNVMGEKIQELYYHKGQPYGWANFDHGKLLKMRKQIFQQEHPVAVENFLNGKYSLQFSCGDLMTVEIDPDSGELKPIPQPTKYACVEP